VVEIGFRDLGVGHGSAKIDLAGDLAGSEKAFDASYVFVSCVALGVDGALGEVAVPSLAFRGNVAFRGVGPLVGVDS
jgi:hypothetical protein